MANNPKDYTPPSFAELMEVIEKLGKGESLDANEAYSEEFRRERPCSFYLVDDGHIPGGIWSWVVYIDGNISNRAPGFTRKSPKKLYAYLTKGEHRVVIREKDATKLGRMESNTLYLTVEDETELVVSVTYANTGIKIALMDSAHS